MTLFIFKDQLGFLVILIPKSYSPAACVYRFSEIMQPFSTETYQSVDMYLSFDTLWITTLYGCS